MGHAHRPSTPPTAFYAVAAVPVCCCMSAELTCPQPPTCSSHPCHSGALPVAPAGGAAVDTAILHKHPRRRRALTRLRAGACWGGHTMAMRPALPRLPPTPPQGATIGWGCPSGFGTAICLWKWRLCCNPYKKSRSTTPHNAAHLLVPFSATNGAPGGAPDRCSPGLRPVSERARRPRRRGMGGLMSTDLGSSLTSIM